ncbi:hypothetical protein HY489_04395 [Candidatus Woesearchaeota archaeon]|nr:hypothetical protein [Candidatus Woesearchaeota archaeon]
MQAKTIMGIFIAAIMVFSIFGVTIEYFAGSDTLKYNGYTFRQVNNQLLTRINGKDYTFASFPADLEYIQLTEETKKLLQKQVLVVTYDTNHTYAEASAQIQYYLETQLDSKIIQRALTNNTNTALPQADCSTATESQPVLQLTYANTSSIKTENNCLTLKAVDPYDLLRQAERITYHVLGIMQ